MKVTLVAATTVRAAIYHYLPPAKNGVNAGPSEDGEYLIEFAGRACYQSFDRPNPATAKTRDYIRKNILEKDHGSVLEHASATFYIEQVSRSLTHELIRHRAGTAYSELSQRYVDMAEVEFVMPPAFRNAGITDEEWQDEPSWASAKASYRHGVDYLDEMAGLRGKRAREAARAFMPSATETKIVMTANYRAWRHILRMRGSEHADAEIRELAVEILGQLHDEAPSVFGDLSVVDTEHGEVIV